MTTREEERLIPVRSPSELRAGMLVVVKAPCPHCRGAHRHLLLRPDKCPWGCADTAWRTPDYRCASIDGRGACLSEAIPEGRVFIVDVGLEDDATAETAATTRKPARVSR